MYCPGKVPPGTVVKEALSCIDFLPTVTSLMGCSIASRLMAEMPIAFSLRCGVTNGRTLRSCALQKAEGWLCAVTDRYKLVYAASGKPWLFDLEQDPMR